MDKNQNLREALLRESRLKRIFNIRDAGLDYYMQKYLYDMEKNNIQIPESVQNAFLNNLDPRGRWLGKYLDDYLLEYNSYGPGDDLGLQNALSNLDMQLKSVPAGVIMGTSKTNPARLGYEDNLLKSWFDDINRNSQLYNNLPEDLVLNRGYDLGLMQDVDPKDFDMTYGPDVDPEMRQYVDSAFTPSPAMEDAQYVFDPEFKKYIDEGGSNIIPKKIKQIDPEMQKYLDDAKTFNIQIPERTQYVLDYIDPTDKDYFDMVQDSLRPNLGNVKQNINNAIDPASKHIYGNADHIDYYDDFLKNQDFSISRHNPEYQNTIEWPRMFGNGTPAVLNQKGGAVMANNTTTTTNKHSKLKDFYTKTKGKIMPKVNNAWAYIKANPAMSAGLGLTGAANIAGLFDNNKIGGQLLGAGAGAGLGFGILPQVVGNVSPQAKILTTLAGGSLGALFDNLRSRAARNREQLQAFNNDFAQMSPEEQAAIERQAGREFMMYNWMPKNYRNR